MIKADPDEISKKIVEKLSGTWRIDEKPEDKAREWQVSYPESRRARARVQMEAHILYV